MFLPPVMRPLPCPVTLERPGLQRIAEAPVSLVRGPPGSYLAEGLAAAILGWSRWQDCVWLRPQDTHPSALATSLAGACLHRWDGGDSAASGVDIHLERVIRSAPAEAVVVLELGGRLTHGAGQLVHGLRPALTQRGISLVVVCESRLPPAAIGRHVVAAADLVTPELLEAAAPGLSDADRDRLARLAGRRAAMVHDVLDAATTWPVDGVRAALGTAATPRLLLDRITAALLEQCGPAHRAALQVCLTSGYWHPGLSGVDVPMRELRPWVVPLEGQWGWLRPIWAKSLRRHLTRRAAPSLAIPGWSPGRPPGLDEAPASATTSEPTRGPGVLEARLLGTLEVRVDGVPVTRWNGPRGTSVLRYLLSRERHACSREQLLEEFWPAVPPQAARNRLQVAVSGLRRAFGQVTTAQVIEYVGGAYRINPGLRLAVDVLQFEQRLSAAREVERAGDHEAAAVALREATRLYRGDFAADAPYEQWTLLPRESLRIRFIDTLDRLSRIEFSTGQFDECIATAHRMLDVDPCREEAHRLLMRCYAEQGRLYPALRQYEFCCRVLRATLETGPAAETTRLYRGIRGGSMAEPPRIGALAGGRSRR
jgi:DNA-binding SARP family transcriptional activator